MGIREVGGIRSVRGVEGDSVFSKMFLLVYGLRGFGKFDLGGFLGFGLVGEGRRKIIREGIGEREAEGVLGGGRCWREDFGETEVVVSWYYWFVLWIVFSVLGK